MPSIEAIDLTSHGVLSHFAQSSRNVALLNFLMALDRQDQWTVDFDENQSPRSMEIQLYIQELQGFIEHYTPVLHRVPEALIDVLAQVTTSRCMYLIHYLSERNERFFESLVVALERQIHTSSSAGIVKRRLDAFKGAELLGEIFSEKRLKRITDIMGSYQDV